MSKNNKIVTINNINTKFLNRNARYEIDKKGPAPTLRKMGKESTSSYNLLSAEEMRERLPLSKILGKRNQKY